MIFWWKFNLLLMMYLGSMACFSQVFPDRLAYRRDANKDELKMMLRLGGCSASALRVNIIITAAHCEMYHSGYFEFDSSYKFKIVKILEKSHPYENDYMIAQILWVNSPPSELNLIRSVLKTEDQIIYSQENDDSLMYSLGFPVDRDKKASYSFGYAKGFKEYPATKIFIVDLNDFINIKRTRILQTNIPLNNGNSGGPVINNKDQLVGTVMGGGGLTTNAERESLEFNSQNPKYFNSISNISSYYEESPILKKLFP